MTREEAIKDIEENILPVVGGESLRMAIEALSSSEIPNSSDSISRKVAIDVDSLDEEIRCDKILRYDAYDYVWRSLQRCIEKLPSAQPERWIPCSERLPKEGQKCLVCNKGTIDIDTFYGWAEPYFWSTYLAEYEAWMPLPKAYKGGNDA